MGNLAAWSCKKEGRSAATASFEGARVPFHPCPDGWFSAKDRDERRCFAVASFNGGETDVGVTEERGIVVVVVVVVVRTPAEEEGEREGMTEECGVAAEDSTSDQPGDVFCVESVEREEMGEEEGKRSVVEGSKGALIIFSVLLTRTGISTEGGGEGICFPLEPRSLAEEAACPSRSRAIDNRSHLGQCG